MTADGEAVLDLLDEAAAAIATAVDALDDRGLAGFLEDVVEEGVFLAPGESFGPYPTHVRLCYTAAPPDVVLRGVEVVARRLGR